MKKIIILILCNYILGFSIINAQCGSDCKKDGGNNEIIKKNVINKLENKKFAKVFERLEEIENNEGIGYFKKQYKGIGCFYFYYCYVKLALNVDNQEFKEYLKSRKITRDFIMEKGRKSAVLADAIPKIFEENSCFGLMTELAGETGSDLEKYLKDIKKLLPKAAAAEEEEEEVETPVTPVSETIAPDKKMRRNIDIELTQFEFKDKGLNIFVDISIRNNGEFDLTIPVTITWEPIKGLFKKSKIVNSLKAGESITESFSHSYPSSGDYISIAEVDVLKEDKDPRNNIVTMSVLVPPQIYGNYNLSYQSTEEGLVLEGVKKAPTPTNHNKGNCLISTHYLELRDLDNKYSGRLNEAFFGKKLLAYLKENNLKESLTIDITGYTDGREFTSWEANKLGDIRNERYFSLNREKWEPITLLNGKRYKTNLELAFIRAYRAKKQLVSFLNIGADRINIFTLENDSKTDEDRKTIIQVCSPEFSRNHLKEIENLTNKELGLSRPIAEVEIQSRVETKVIELKRFNFSNVSIGQKIKIEDLLFDADSIQIKEKYFEILDDLAGELKRTPKIIVEIGGHTNDRCQEVYCKKLSEKRAKSVVDYLIKKGVRSDLLSFKGYGKEEIKYESLPMSSRMKNQRVEIKVLGN